VERHSDLPKKLKSILRKKFPTPDEVSIRTNDGVIAIVVSEQFEGRDDLDRQDLVWNLLNQELTRDERRQIAIIVTVTPREEAGHLASELD
jgi:acid stress-induced BolA-like protein IbaG/YrbA